MSSISDTNVYFNICISFFCISFVFLSLTNQLDLFKKNLETFTLQIWDTAGQERFKSLRTPFYRGSDICLLVFAVNDRQSLENLTQWKKEFLYYADVKDPENFPFLVLGNKVDMEEERVVHEDDAKSWCQLNGQLPYFETSAKDNTNVELAFSSSVKRHFELEQKLDRQMKNVAPGGVNLSNHETNKKASSCC